jgi:hypothetical protein
MSTTPRVSGPGRGERAAVLVLAGMALFLFLLGLLEPAGLNVPPAIAYVLAFALLMAAAALASRLAGRTRANALFAALVLLGFAATGAWIALARDGPRSCVARLGPAENAGREVPVSPTTCRVAFGSGALICLAMAGGAVLLARRRDPP